MADVTQPTQTLFSGKYVSLAARGHWEYATRNTTQPAVAIVALTDDNRIVLVEQNRIPIGASTLELPAGLSADAPGAENEPLVEAAKRELLEETGYAAAQWTELVLGYSSPGLTDESIVIFLAEGLQRVGQGGGDDSEAITVHEVPLCDVIPWLLASKAAVDFKIFAGLALAQFQRQLGSAG